MQQNAAHIPVTTKGFYAFKKNQTSDLTVLNIVAIAAACMRTESVNAPVAWRIDLPYRKPVQQTRAANR
ncbi:MAG: hypothetical protein EPN59_10630 [Paraburkholderia sp.]|nr:MAG: hypothetical protein EPN59_10630 [Paraburkholderia sp.]